MQKWINLFVGSLLAIGCSGPVDTKSVETEAAFTGAGSANIAESNDPQLPDQKSVIEDIAGPTSDGSSGEEGETPVNAGDGSTLGDGSPLSGANDFFQTSVSVHFDQACSGCHAAPRFGVENPAPLTIFSREKMLLLLKSDLEQFQASALYLKLSGVTSHGGGNRCGNAIEAKTCQLIAQWWELETGNVAGYKFEAVDEVTGGNGDNGDNDPGGSIGGGGPPIGGSYPPPEVAGGLNPVSTEGRVTGWAATPNDFAETSVIAFLDGPPGAGIEVVEAVANQIGYDGGRPGSHAFAMSLPLEYRDGDAHMLYVYANVQGELVEVQNSPVTFTAYRKSTAGRDYFEANISGALQNSCGGCHSVSYDQQWASLISPPPALGGTAAGNQLVGKAGGGLPHNGGNRCGGVNNGLCSLLQTWWGIEFN